MDIGIGVPAILLLIGIAGYQSTGGLSRRFFVAGTVIGVVALLAGPHRLGPILWVVVASLSIMAQAASLLLSSRRARNSNADAAPNRRNT